MSIRLNFTTPEIYNLSHWQIGQSTTSSGTLVLVASGTNIGTYPEWINSIGWSGANTFYYSVRFITDDNHTTAWSDRIYGKYQSSLGYFILRPSGSKTVYLVPTPTSGSTTVPTWLDYNKEYTVTITASGLYGENTNFMEEDYSFSFTSEYCPLFTNVYSVRMSVGPIVEGIPDDTINRYIHRASQDLVSRFFNGVNPYGCSRSIPEPIFRWTTCAASLHSLNAAVAGAGQGVGNTRKTLGQLSISYDGNTDALSPKDVRKHLNECLQQSENQLSALLGRGFQYAVKSIYNTRLTHPMVDPKWGRMPRKVDEAIDGPWSDSEKFGDLKTYQPGVNASGFV